MIRLMLAVMIELSGVTGDDIRTRAFFDANNVKVGDPLVFTLDFYGEADFTALHPPRLSRHVDGKDWKLDDASAKTVTVPGARRLTYRVRPMRKGLLYFPSLEFGYAGGDGTARKVRSNEIPVHAKAGAQVVVEEMDDFIKDGMPRPDPLIFESGVEMGDDDAFAWCKACAKPTADAFARFDFPAARLNEAACAVREGNWARALKLYRSLEWSIGQTPAVERGIVAALALRYDNPSVELPVWRQVGRPVLKYGWKLRLAITAGILAALALFFKLAGKLLRMVACASLITLPFLSAEAFMDPFESFEKVFRRGLQGQMSRAGFFSGGEEAESPAVEMSARVVTDRAELQVGDGFEYIVELEVPKALAIGNISISVSNTDGMRQIGNCENYPDRESPDNPSNVVKRIAVPVRYDAPFDGRIVFSLDVPYTYERKVARRGFSFSSVVQRSERVVAPPLKVEVKPLPEKGRPEGYSGIVAGRLDLVEMLDMVRVETNDVVQITYTLSSDGYLPKNFVLPSTAFEIDRREERRTGETTVSWRRYFVADGKPSTPRVALDYYDVKAKEYKTRTVGGTPLEYMPERPDGSDF